MFTPGQVSEMLDIPASSLRRYATIFAQFLDQGARRRKRLYTDQDILTLRRVRDFAAHGLTTGQIAQRLEVVEVDQPNNALALLPNVLREFEILHSMQSDQDQRIEQLRSEIEQLREEIRQQRRPWWRRWGK